MRQTISWIVSTASLLLGGVALAGADKDGAEHEPRHMAMRFAMGGGRLGVEAIPISKEVRQMLGAPEDAGVLVNKVQSDSVAAEAGVKAGDVIVEVDGQKVKEVSTLRRVLSEKDAGQTAQLVVMREKNRTTLTAKMREKAKEHAFESFDFPEGFMADGPFRDVRKDLEKLGQRLAEVEKRLQQIEPKR